MGDHWRLFGFGQAGHTHTGVASFVVADEGLELIHEDGSWDCREWQWWQDHGRGDEKWPRLVPATSGYEERGNESCVTSGYTCDDVHNLSRVVLPTSRP